MKRNMVVVILLQSLLWVMALIMIVQLWDKWMLDGPHGQYRWVGMDFAPFWVGVRQMLHGVNPYSPETLLKIQEVVYGGPALGADPMMFVYPAWMFILIAPFSLMPYKWAVFVYASLLLWALFNFLYKLAAITGAGNLLAQSLWFVLLVFGSLPFLVISATKGQLGYFSLLTLFAARQLSTRRPLMAGILLGFALIKPTVTVIPVAGFLLWALSQKEWKILSGFTGVLMLLVATSYLAVGNWMPDYFDMLSIRGGMPVLWSIDSLSPPWSILYIVFIAGTGMWLLYLSYKKKRGDWFSAWVLVGIALTPMRWIYDLFLGILILGEKRTLSAHQSVMAGIAILSPWFLVLVPEPMRWNAAVVGLPLTWAIALVVFLFPDSLEATNEIEAAA